MAQSTILAAGTGQATSSDVSVLAGAVVTIGLFSGGADNLPKNAVAVVKQDTPAKDIQVVNLDRSYPSTQIYGPGTFRVTRQQGDNVGVFLED